MILTINQSGKKDGNKKTDFRISNIKAVMNKLSYAIVTTTINPIEVFLKEYSNNIQSFGWKDCVSIYIAGDRKYPLGANELIDSYRKLGYKFKFLDINWQLDYLRKYPDLLKIIPECSDNRRNVGFLVALEEGADTIISVDDDNFPIQGNDFIGSHSCVGKICSEPEAVGSDGWFNIISLLNNHAENNLYPRGFPYHQRKGITNNIVSGQSTGKVSINAGLWLNDPDVDAIGRLQINPTITGWKNQSVLLHDKTNSPINTQNTALSRETMASYYYIKMGEPINGMLLDRYGDIFSGYFASACAKAMGHKIRIGTPIAEHRRNTHNLFIDLYNELAGMMIIEDLSIFIQTVDLPKTSYSDAYKALSRKLEDFVMHQEGFIWQDDTRNYFIKICNYMRIWADITSDIIGS